MWLWIKIYGCVYKKVLEFISEDCVWIVWAYMYFLDSNQNDLEFNWRGGWTICVKEKWYSHPAHPLTFWISWNKNSCCILLSVDWMYSFPTNRRTIRSSHRLLETGVKKVHTGLDCWWWWLVVNGQPPRCASRPFLLRLLPFDWLNLSCISSCPVAGLLIHCPANTVPLSVTLNPQSPSCKNPPTFI